MATRRFKFVEWQGELEQPEHPALVHPDRFAPISSPALKLQCQLEAMLVPATDRDNRYPLAVRVALPIVLSFALWAFALHLL